MHILTKILVVFAAVLSLALAALTSSYAMNRDTITSGFNNAIAERDKAKANYNTQSSQFAEERQKLQEQINDLNDQLGRVTNAKREVESTIAELRLQSRSAEDRADLVTGQIAELGKTADTQAELITSYRGEVQQLRRESLDIRNENIALVDRINDLESQNEVLIQSNRSLQVTIAELQRGEDETVAANTGSSEPQALRGDLIVGRVREVRTNNGQQYAEIDLGTRDRMRENVKLHITRNGDFVANLIVVRTDLQSSVGRVDTVGDPSVQVRPGDMVLSSLTR
ncbi:MAG: hypothetical protein KDA31_06415 [Phycisphaerales bacterium]|nr:hypothetical protein [Phycisphaerales bacterium]